MENKLTMEDQLRIANSGGQFQETGQNSWVGTLIRKGDKKGKVTGDMNGAWRILTITFDDGTTGEIRMPNIGFDDPPENHQYEWYDKLRDIWYRF